MIRTTGIVDSVREFVAERGEAAVRDFRRRYPGSVSVPQAFQHLERRREIAAVRTEPGRGRLGVRKVYAAHERIVAQVKRGGR